mmetsp:Transcript_40660/g.65047  ORF Transcript_40660/g.65047 Transcript_40660/m.65047 type:complete len:112 (-) Transcript_40660:42-377(-)
MREYSTLARQPIESTWDSYFPSACVSQTRSSLFNYLLSRDNFKFCLLTGHCALPREQVLRWTEKDQSSSKVLHDLEQMLVYNTGLSRWFHLLRLKSRNIFQTPKALASAAT